MTVLVILLRILIGLVIAVVALFYFFQAKLLFHPTKLEKSFAFKFSIPHEEKFITYGDETLHALLFKAKNPKLRIIYFHGNAGALDSWGQVGVDLVEKLNADVLIVDFPGYGKSTGDVPKSERPLYVSAEAAFEELLKSTDAKLPILVYGRSLGSAVASHLALYKNIQALILETPYTSIKSMAAVVFPFLPSFIVRYDLDNEKNLSGTNVPLLIIHGTSDNVIPYTQGKELFSQKASAEFVTIEGGTHNDLPEHPKYWEAVSNFVVKILN